MQTARTDYVLKFPGPYFCGYVAYGDTRFTATAVVTRTDSTRKASDEAELQDATLWP